MCGWGAAAGRVGQERYRVLCRAASFGVTYMGVGGEYVMLEDKQSVVPCARVLL